jgi:hypothetical protein
MRARRCRVSINGEQRSIQRAFIGQETPLQIVVPNAGRNIVELQIDRVDGELTDTNNRAIALVDGIRENLRVCWSRRTACWRAHLAQSPEIDADRSGTFHHSAPAGKAGRRRSMNCR